MADMLGYKDTGTCIFYIYVHVVHISRSFQVPRKIFQAHLVCWPSNQKGQKEGEKKSGEKSNPLQFSCLDNPHGQRTEEIPWTENSAGYSPWVATGHD